MNDKLESLLESNSSLLLFDGVCQLCHSSVQFILQRERGRELFFSSLQSELGEELLLHFSIPKELDSIVLIEKGRVYTHSDAALLVARHLRWPWLWLGYLGFVFPKFLRDAVYRFVAQRRYRWFGKTDQCMLPSPELKERFF